MDGILSVYSGRDRQTRRIVAIRRLTRSLIASDMRREKMTRETINANKQAVGFRVLALTENTRRAYRKGWACFAD